MKIKERITNEEIVRKYPDSCNSGGNYVEHKGIWDDWCGYGNPNLYNCLGNNEWDDFRVKYDCSL